MGRALPRWGNRAALCALAACTLIAGALLMDGGARAFGEAGIQLLSQQDTGAGGDLTVRSERVYSKIEKMNGRLRKENNRLHSLLRRDETVNMHVEQRLNHAYEAEHSRREVEQRKARSLRQELDAILNQRGDRDSDVPSYTQSGDGSGDSGDGSGDSSSDSGFGGDTAGLSGEGTRNAAAELLKQATDEADQQLGVPEQHRAASTVLQKEFVADAAGFDEGHASEVGGESREQEEREEEDRARERRALTREERRRYDTEMRRSERDLRDGHPYRARREARHALEMHQREEQLRGFEGKEERAAPEAWKLLDKTIKDDIKDRVQQRRVEGNMEAVVELKHDVQSAKHQYREERHELGAFASGHGRIGLMLEAPTSGGGFAAEKEVTSKLDKELNDEERAWDRANALEAAKAAASEELRAAEGGGVPAARPHPEPHRAATMPAPATAAPRGQEEDVEARPAPRVGAGVPFIPKTFWQGENFVGKTAREINAGGPHADKDAAKARKSQLAMAAGGKGTAGGGRPHGQGKYVLNKKHVRYIGAAKSLPGQPAEVANDIVERLLKLAHTGQLKSPEDHPARVRHPMSAAIAEHQAEQRRLLRVQMAHGLATPKLRALVSAGGQAAAKLRRKHERLDALKTAEAVTARAFAAPRAARAAVAAVDAAAAARGPRAQALPPPRVFAARGRVVPVRGESATAGRAGGIWGRLVHSLFGDSTVHKTYLPE